MKRFFNCKHLTNARVSYFTHFKFAISEAWFLLLMCLASVLHAIFPFIFDFKLLELRVNRLLVLYKLLPKHEIWKDLRNKLDE